MGKKKNNINSYRISDLSEQIGEMLAYGLHKTPELISAGNIQQLGHN
jgi:hypothetical protein